MMMPAPGIAAVVLCVAVVVEVAFTRFDVTTFVQRLAFDSLHSKYLWIVETVRKLNQVLLTQRLT
jgi:hypothetical protein